MTKVALVSVISVLITALLYNTLSGPTIYAEDYPTEKHQNLHHVIFNPITSGPGMGGQPLIPVTLNDAQTATFLADTGTSDTIISTELAKQMKLYLQPVLDAEGRPGIFNGSAVMTTNLSALCIGTLRFTDMKVIVLDSQAISLFPDKHTPVPYSGILGSDQLQRFAILLDESQHQFGICVPGGLSQHQISQLGITQPAILPLTGSGFQNKWFVPAQFINKGLKADENMLVDTGADSTTVSTQLEQTLGLKMTGQQGNKTAYGNAIIATTTADEMDLGDVKLQNISLSVRSVSEKLPPLLGMNVLAKYRVLIDFPAKKIYLQPHPVSVPAVAIKPQQ